MGGAGRLRGHRPGRTGDQFFGLHYLVAGILLNVWFLVALALADGLPAQISANPWQQALAWLIGSAVWIAFTFIVWLARGRQSQPSPLPEIPDGFPPVKVTRPVVLFVLILSRSKVGSSCWPAVSSWRQAARLYSLISPFRMDFRRIR